MTPTVPGDLLLLLLAVLAGGHALSLARRERWHLFDPLNFFWVGMFFVYGFQVVEYGSILVPWHGVEWLNRLLFAALFLALFVVLGYESTAGRALSALLPPIAPRLDPDRLLQASICLMGVGVLGYLMTFYQVGGIANFLAYGRGWAPPVRALPVPAALQTLLLQLPHVLLVGCVLLLLRARLFHLPPGSQLIAWVLCGLLWLWFLYLGTRGRLIWLTLVLVYAACCPGRRSPPLLVAVAVLVLLFVLTSFQATYRSQFTHLSLNPDVADKNEIWDTVLPSFLRSHALGQEVNASAGLEANCAMTVLRYVPDSVPYNYGYGHLEVFTRFIPKVVWKHKRFPHLEAVQGIMVKGGLSDHLAGDSNLVSGPALSIVGHWYLAGGYVGLAVGGVLCGILLRSGRGILDRAGGNQAHMLLFPFVMLVGFLDAVSTPFYWLLYLPWSLGPLCLVLVSCRAAEERRGDPVVRTNHPRARRFRERRQDLR